MKEIQQSVSAWLFGRRHSRLSAAWKACLAALLLVMVASSSSPIPAAAGVLAAQPTPGEGQPVTDTFAAVADAMVDSYRSALNFGGGQGIAVGYYSGDGAAIYRGLARFDLSSLPPEAVIVSADLVLYADQGTVSKQILAWRLTGSWSEAAVTWNNQPGHSAPQSNREVDLAAGPYVWDVRQTVQDWVSGAQANHGFLLQAADEAENGYRSFRSREAPQGQPNLPNVRLVVTWMLPVGPIDPGPEPVEQTYLPLVFDVPDSGPVPIEISPCPQVPIWTLLRGMDAAHYQQSANDFGAAGFRPISVSVEGEGDQARFNVIWIKDWQYQDNWVLRHDMTSDDLQNEFDTLKTLGFRPTLVDAYGQGGGTRYVAAWVKDDLPVQMNHGLSRTDFSNMLVFSDTLKGWTLAPQDAGWRPLWVSVNGDPGDPRFSSIFAMDDQQGILDFDKTFSQLKDLNGLRTSLGYRLLHLSGYRVDPDPNISNDDGVRYAASWVKDPDQCGFVKWQVLESQDATRLDLEALNASGIRHKTFSDPTLVLNPSDLGNSFRNGRFEISAPQGTSLSSLSEIAESIPGTVFQDGDVILLQPKVGQIITVKETQDGNIDLKAPDDSGSGGQRFVMQGYNYILALQYDAGSGKWVELQRDGLPHERYWPISVDEFSDPDGRVYNSVWVQSDPERTARTSYASGDDPLYFQDLDQVMQQYMQDRDIPGGALAATKDGRLVMARGYTWEPDGTLDVPPDAKFRLASISKPLTAAALVRLMEADGLSLDTPVYAILGADGWSDPAFQQVTVRQLLNHIGGWDRDLSFDPMFQDAAVCTYAQEPLPVTPQMIIDYMKTQPLDHEPGTVFNYSNFGYSILGRIIETLTGQTYNSYMRNQFFIPIGMLDTWPGLNYESEAYWKEVNYYTPRNQIARDRNDGTALDGNLVCDINTAQRVMLPYGGFNITALDSHGGWISSASDLNRLLTAINDGSLLDASQYAAVFQRPPGLAPRVLYADSGPVVDKTIQALTPSLNWTAISAAAQYLYVGKGLAPFSAVDVTLASPGAGYDLQVDYWDGAAFIPLTDQDDNLVDETQNLTQSGQITFTPPNDWTPRAVNGETRFWLRIRTQSAASTIAKFDLLEPDYDNSRYYGFGWFMHEVEHRLNFQSGVNAFQVGEWVAGLTSRTVAQVKDVTLLSPPGVTPSAGYLILENMKGGPFYVDEVILGQSGASALTNGPGLPETFSATHDGILDGSRTFMYRRSDGVTWAALFNMRVGDQSIPLYMPGGTVVDPINSVMNNLSASDWPAYDLFP